MADEPQGYLLRGGTVIGNDKVNPEPLKNHDVLIIGDWIETIGVNLKAPMNKNIQVIDCTKKIVAPGFISTHNHLWQTQLKGRHGNDTQQDFNLKGNDFAAWYRAYDVYLGVLAGSLECIDAGITTAVDNANMAITAAHSPAALAAIRDSNIRAVFCYTPPESNSLFSRPTIETRFPLWSLDQFEAMSQLKLPSRISLGVSIDSVTSLSMPATRKFFQSHRFFRSNPLLAVHWAKHEAFPSDREHAEFLGRLNILEAETGNHLPHILIAHGNHARPQAVWRNVVSNQATKINHVSVPYAEASLGLGIPLVHSALDLQHDRTSLGIGCHSINAADMFTQMRTTLALNRLAHTQAHHDMLNESEYKRATVRTVFDLATRKGAEAIGNSKIGSLFSGAKADVVVYDTSSIRMSLAADEDPYTAVVNYATSADVEMVFIDGVLRKSNSRVHDLNVTRMDAKDNDEAFWWILLKASSDVVIGSHKETWDWPKLRAALIQSRTGIMNRQRKTPNVIKHGRVLGGEYDLK